MTDNKSNDNYKWYCKDDKDTTIDHESHLVR